MDRKSLLVIRGGAIGDFILTLPALRLLREGFPDCRLEIIGYRHICAIAEGRFYADAVRSIEYSAMAGFFNPRAALDDDLSRYFSGFGQVISYLFDPDGFFESNLRRCGVRNLIVGDPRINGSMHAARQLALPLEQLALFLEDPAAAIFPTDADGVAAAALTGNGDGPRVIVHPGSGSGKKNWPLPQWRELIARLTASTSNLAVIGGESDTVRIELLRAEFGGRVTFLEGLPLPVLGAVLARADLYVGHDTGISHLAAAAGAPCLLLFGPTDPEVWAPANPGVTVIQAPGADLAKISCDHVVAGCEDLLGRCRDRSLR